METLQKFAKRCQRVHWMLTTVSYRWTVGECSSGAVLSSDNTSTLESDSLLSKQLSVCLHINWSLITREAEVVEAIDSWSHAKWSDPRQVVHRFDCRYHSIAFVIFRLSSNRSQCQWKPRGITKTKTSAKHTKWVSLVRDDTARSQSNLCSLIHSWS